MDICPAFDDMWPRGYSRLLHTYDIIETGPKETQIYAVFSGELISLQVPTGPAQGTRYSGHEETCVSPAPSGGRGAALGFPGGQPALSSALY